jgi:integrase
LLALERGTDPKMLAGGAGTIDQLIEEYIEHHARPNKRTWRDDDRLLRKDVLPRWRGRPAREITRRDVVELLDKVGRRGGPIRERVRSICSSMFRLGIERGLVEVNPVSGVTSSGSNPRERILADAEIRTVWHGLNASSVTRPAKLAIKLLLLTAQRRGELTGARWAEIDLEAGTWYIPAERSKNGHAHRVPLSGDAVALFRQLRAAMSDTCPYVLGHRHGGRWKPYNPTSLSNVPKRYDFFGCAPWTIHDLRRTASTRLHEAGVAPHIVERILNHLPPLLVRTYDRSDYSGPMRDALEVWAAHVRQVVEGAA